MSAIPSRTKSVRKTAENASKHNGYVAEPNEQLAAVSRPARISQSPSRLPVKPTTRSSTTTRPSSSANITTNTSLRPPSSRSNVSKPTTVGLQRSLSGRRSNAGPTADIEPVKKDRSRPPITTSRHLRNTSTSSSITASTREPSQTRTRSSTTLPNASSTRPPTRGSDESKAHAEVHSLLKKPAFSTHQQHFSPAKSLAPKPHPAAFLAPPSPSKLPSNIAISSETAKLQNELLQLHLLHKSAGSINQEWRASAKRKLGEQFQAVVEKNDKLVSLEVEETGKLNAAALRKWQDLGTPGWGLEERIQVLDEVLSGVWNIGESGGRYSRVVRRFERWLSRCQDIIGAREHDDGLEDDEVVFLEELDDQWKDDCLVIGRKLEIWRDNLRDLGSPDSGSSLGMVVDGCQGLVRGMLMELNVMAKIEEDAMAMELEWIKCMNNEDDDGDTPIAGAIWRST